MKELNVFFNECSKIFTALTPDERAEINRVLNEPVHIDSAHTRTRAESFAKQLHEYCESDSFNTDQKKDMLALAQQWLEL